MGSETFRRKQRKIDTGISHVPSDAHNPFKSVPPIVFMTEKNFYLKCVALNKAYPEAPTHAHSKAHKPPTNIGHSTNNKIFRMVNGPADLCTGIKQ